MGVEVWPEYGDLTPSLVVLVGDALLTVLLSAMPTLWAAVETVIFCVAIQFSNLVRVLEGWK